MRLPLAKDGCWLVVAGTLVLLGPAAAAIYLCRAAWPGFVVAAPLVALWAWLIWFFRDPERAIPQGEGLFVCPADGMVTDITPLGADSILGASGRRIGVFMNVLNVHVNRAPCDGVVLDKRINRGGKDDVRREQAWHHNESVALLLEYAAAGSPPAKVAVRQVAGMVARRIVCHPRPGDKLVRGGRIGMIRFGSRLELMLSDELNAEILVSPGQRVWAGSTILARQSSAGRTQA
jgi:phosphatidylserine decarboxylase